MAHKAAHERWLRWPGFAGLGWKGRYFMKFLLLILRACEEIGLDHVFSKLCLAFPAKAGTHSVTARDFFKQLQCLAKGDGFVPRNVGPRLLPGKRINLNYRWIILSHALSLAMLPLGAGAQPASGPPAVGVVRAERQQITET